MVSGGMAVRPTLTRDETGTLHGRTTGIVAVTTGLFAVGAFPGRDLASGWGLLFFLDGRRVDDAYGVDLNADVRRIAGDQKTYQFIRQPGPIAPRRFEIEYGAADVTVCHFPFG